MLTRAARLWITLRGTPLVVTMFTSSGAILMLVWTTVEDVLDGERPQAVEWVGTMAPIAVCGLALFSWVASPRLWWVTFRYACLETFSLGLWLWACRCS